MIVAIPSKPCASPFEKVASSNFNLSRGWLIVHVLCNVLRVSDHHSVSAIQILSCSP
jgi:hypothetical protein